MSKYLDYTGLQRLVENIDKKYAPIAALIFKSIVDDIEHLPDLATVKPGWMYNVTVGGGTTTDFVEGAGHILGDGENVAAVELITGYTPVPSVSGTEDPKALGWYESDGATEPTYTLSEDRIADTGKTYFTADTVKKWDTLGGVFDLEGRYLEFGQDFPQGPASRMVDGRTFLYMGETRKVYTAVAAPEGRPSDNGYFEGVFAEVADPSTIVNPSQVPLYVVDTTVAAKYVVGTPVADPAAEGFYEEDTTPGTYIPSADTSVDPSKTYYKKVDTYKRTTDITVDDTATYFEGTFVASADITVDADKVYYTEADLYKKASIYTYDLANTDWVAQSSGGSGDIIPITIKEVDDLFI